MKPAKKAPVKRRSGPKVIRKRLSDPPQPTKVEKARPRLNATKAKAEAEIKQLRKKPMTKHRATLLKRRMEKHKVNSVDALRTIAAERTRKDFALKELARKRMRQGLSPSESITITMPPQHQIALQVKAGKDKEWSTVVGLKYYPGMPHGGGECTCVDCLKASLKDKLMGWQNTGYFGSDAVFEIREVIVPARSVQSNKRSEGFRITLNSNG
jgi:hypothetical protein